MSESHDSAPVGRKVDIEMGSIAKSRCKNDEREEDRENNWSFGCCKLDKRCVQYFAQLGILSICIGVSLFQVSTKTDNRDFWIGLLSSSIGILVPNPKLKK